MSVNMQQSGAKLLLTFDKVVAIQPNVCVLCSKRQKGGLLHPMFTSTSSLSATMYLVKPKVDNVTVTLRKLITCFAALVDHQFDPLGT